MTMKEKITPEESYEEMKKNSSEKEDSLKILDYKDDFLEGIVTKK